MNVITNSLDDLIKTKDILVLLIEQYKEEKRKIEKMGLTGPQEIQAVDISSINIQFNGKMMFIDALKRIKKIESHLLILNKELDKKNKIIYDIEKKIKKLSGLEEKVFFLRRVKGLTQEKTAEKLDISIIYVQKIERRIRENNSKT